MDIKDFLDKIICGDALKCIPKLPNESIDLCLTDPPYQIPPPTKITRKGGKFGVSTDINAPLSENSEIIQGVDYEEWIPLVYEKLKPTGVLITFCGKQHISDVYRLLEELGMTIRHVVAWVKSNPPPQARKVKWMDAWEPIIIATKNRGMGHHYNWKLGQHKDVIVTPICQGRERREGGHPTQKPIRLIEPLIKWWSYEGDIILDPFCGSGTTCVVAKMYNRHYIGIEINPKWVEIAEQRLKKIQTNRLSKYLK